MKRVFTVENDNIKMIEFLSDCLANVSKASLQKQMSLREIKVNSKRINQNILLNKGDVVEIFLPLKLESAVSNLDIKIVYEDVNIVIIDKPVLCDVENHALGFLRKRYEYVMPVHRLDRNTKGLVVFALNEKSYEELLFAFKNRTIKKYYSALVEGVVEPKSAELVAYLKKDSGSGFVSISDKPKEGYSKIVTFYEIERVIGNQTLLNVLLITGRTHQIRAHLAFIGYPLVGDYKYGKASDFKGGFGEKLSFQALTAEKIGFGGFSGILAYLNEKSFKRNDNVIW